MEKFQESLTCPICLALLVAPVESNCSHTFCLECALTFIQKTNETTKLSCPICRSLISEMKPSGALRRIVASIGDSNPKLTRRKENAQETNIKKLDEKLSSLLKEKLTVPKKSFFNFGSDIHKDARLSIRALMILIVCVVVIMYIPYFNAKSNSYQQSNQQQSNQQEKSKPTNFQQTPSNKKQTTPELSGKQKQMIFDPKDEWLYAAFTGDNKQIYSFLSNPRFDINKQDKMGFSALYIASKEGNLETVKLLIESGATVDLNSMDFATPLYVASEFGHASVVSFLLQNGANVSKRFRTGATPLVIACDNGFPKIVERLLQEPDIEVDALGAQGQTCLHLAAEKNHFIIAGLVVAKGANLNLRSQSGMTPLYYASRGGFSEIVKLLLANNVKIDLASNEKATPLYVASEYGRTEIVKLLVKQRADINTKFSSGATPVLIAAQKGFTEIVHFLLEKGAKLDGAGAHDLTALHLAVLGGHIDVVRLLLEYGLNVDYQNKELDTSLHLACRNKFVAIVQLLLHFGANFRLQNKKGISASDENPQLRHLFDGLKRIKVKIIPVIIEDFPENSKVIGTTLIMNSVSTMSDLKVRVSYAMQATVVDIYDREGMIIARDEYETTKLERWGQNEIPFNVGVKPKK